MSIISDFAHEELCNWSRWAWQGEYPHPLPSSRCGSAEGDFHAEWHLGDEDAEPPRLKPNARNAQRVQAMWESWPLGFAPRLVLKAEYPARYTSGRNQGGREVAARRLGMTLSQYEQALAWAGKQVEERFANALCA